MDKHRQVIDLPVPRQYVTGMLRKTQPANPRLCTHISQMMDHSTKSPNGCSPSLGVNHPPTQYQILLYSTKCCNSPWVPDTEISTSQMLYINTFQHSNTTEIVHYWVNSIFSKTLKQWWRISNKFQESHPMLMSYVDQLSLSSFLSPSLFC